MRRAALRGVCLKFAIGIGVFAVLSACIASANGSRNEVLVKFAPGHEVTAFAANMASGSRTVDRIPQLGVQRLQAPIGLSAEEAERWYETLPFVEFAEVNGTCRATALPNDPYIDMQWGLSKVSAFAGWDFGQGSGDVKIAILDTGVDMDHPDLVAKLVDGWDFVNRDENPDDDHGHGTHCAGIAAASTNNGAGIAGIGYNCRIMPLKVLGADGSGYWSDISLAIVHAAKSGAKVISMSLGATEGSLTMREAIDFALANGVTVVAAAGNESTSALHYPAAFPGCIAVGSSDPDDAKSSFSNYGDWVDVAAPGSSIASTYLDGSYARMSGTSMAAPLVAGLAGLVWSHLGADSSAQAVRERIESRCDPVGTWVAHGRVNVRMSLSEVVEPPVELQWHVADLQMIRGEVHGGTIGDLASSDDALFWMAPVLVGRYFKSEARFHFVISNANTTAKKYLEFEVQGATGITASASLYNVRSGRWESLKSLRTATADAKYSFKLRSDLTKYMSPEGALQVRFVTSNRKMHHLAFDQMKVRSDP